MYYSQPQYNWRLTDLSAYAGTHAGGSIIIAANAVGPLDAIGNPLVLPGSGVTTFLLDEFEQRRLDVVNNDILRNHAGPSVRAFDDLFTISDGFWGVFLVIINNNGDISNIARSLLMEFPTEQAALDACPQVPPGFGRVAIGTIQAVGGDFIAGTTNTDAGLVAAFNTFDHYGFRCNIPTPHTGEFYSNAFGNSSLKSPAGSVILGGRGVAGGTPDDPDRSGDALVVTLREVGADVVQTVQANTNWTVGYRPWPVGGEGLGDVSVSQTPSTFVP